MKTYMVPVSYTVRLTVYHEVIAENAKQAERKVHEEVNITHDTEYIEVFQDEAKTELSCGIDASALVIGRAERANKFHTQRECKLCAVFEPKE